MSSYFNEDSRVKIPTILRLKKSGYEYLSLNESGALFVFAFKRNRLYDAEALLGLEGKKRGIKNLLFDSKHISQTLPSESMQHLKAKVFLMHSMIRQNSKQNYKLIEHRDWLLPMLTNGQVKVKTEKGYEEVDGELRMVAESGRSNS